MRRALPAVVLLAAALPMLAAGTLPAAGDIGQSESATTAISVELDRADISAGPGEKIRFESTVRNTGDQDLSGLIAHVSILSSDPDVYVDPEDWSPRRTQFIDDLPAGTDTRLAWEVRAVTTGPLILYVAVTESDSSDVTVSGPLRMTVGGRREVNAGNVLPLVLGMPAMVVLLLGLTGIRRRRLR